MFILVKLAYQMRRHFRVRGPRFASGNMYAA